MSRYELFLALHILGAMAWIGSGFLLLVLAGRAARQPDGEALGRIVVDTADLGVKLFIPASLLTLAMGVLLVLDGPWSFDQLWVVLGLAGFATTFVTGAMVLKPAGDRVAEMRRHDGGMSPQANYAARRMLTLGRLDYVVLVMVVIDMALKPTGDDVAVLGIMAAILLGGIVAVVAAYRSIEAPAPATA